MKSDIEIARSIKLENINQIAGKVNIPHEELIQYGKYIAKIPIECIDEKAIGKNNLILVTSISPTEAGIGKTTVSIGLTLGLNAIGKKSIVALREPSLGPCFGKKGGAAGGGYAQVLPMENINLHFTGDFHAITSAHNLISAMLDNYQYFQHKQGKQGLKQILWKRVLDMNDRSLRYIDTRIEGKADSDTSSSGFDITPASEIMAILCLSKNLDDLRRRVENILLGYDEDEKPFTVKQLGAAGAVTVLLKDAINPNLVQTTEHTPAIVHGGPFANIAHGCNSVLATKMALSYGEYVITEAGFGADLGAEKFFNIKCRKSGLQPKLTILVVTTQALKMHGGVALDAIKQPNKEGINEGFKNLDKHISNIQSFGQTVLVVLNKYAFDTEEEIEQIAAHAQALGADFVINNAFAEGSKGAIALAEKVVKTIQEKPSGKLQFTYNDHDSLHTKLEKVARQIYGADKITYSETAEKKLQQLEADQILSGFPVCIAKTQYSFTTDPKAYGVLKDFDIAINDIVINQGAEFIVAIAGNMMRMPGLPRVPQALNIDLVDGHIEGLS